MDNISGWILFAVVASGLCVLACASFLERISRSIDAQAKTLTRIQEMLTYRLYPTDHEIEIERAGAARNALGEYEDPGRSKFPKQVREWRAKRAEKP